MKQRRREGESPPPLTPEQQELVRRYMRVAARTALVLTADCRRLIDEDEATSLGYYALCRAAAAFDPSFGVNFWTFARVAIRRLIWAKSTIEDRHVHYQLDSADAEHEARPADFDARRRLRRVAEWAAGHAEREAIVEAASRAGRGDPRRRHLLKDRVPRHRGWGIEVAA